MRFGDVAVARGLVTQDVIDRMIALQQRLNAERGAAPPLGRMLVAHGYIQPKDRDAILSSNDTMFGRICYTYRIEAFIARGSMGSVFRARDLTDGKRVALKILYKNLLMDDVNFDMFVQECRASCLLKHDSIVAGYSYGQAHGRPYYAMELVESESLDERLVRDKKVPEPEALEILQQIASGLEAAHAMNILHRDIKPSNIFWDGKRAKLGDLGLSLSMLDHRQKARDEGFVVGTPHYTSPEQAEGLINVTSDADIYCLVASMYHIVCGLPPFPDEDVDIALEGHISGSAPNPLTHTPDLSIPFVNLLAWMMARRVRDRIATATALLNEISRIRNGQYPTTGRKLPPDCTFSTRIMTTSGRIWQAASTRIRSLIEGKKGESNETD